MIRSALLVFRKPNLATESLRRLEDLLERLDPVVDVMSVQSGQSGADWIRRRLDALDIRVGDAQSVDPESLWEECHRNLEARTGAPPLVVLDTLPPEDFWKTQAAPLLLLPTEVDVPVSLREVVVSFDRGRGPALATTLATLCRGSGAAVTLLCDGCEAAALEGVRRRLEAAGASIVVRRRRTAKALADDLATDHASAPLIALGASLATPELVASLVRKRCVLLLPSSSRSPSLVQRT